MTLNNSMSITPMPPAKAKGRGRTWVSSRWKNPCRPGQFSVEINSDALRRKPSEEFRRRARIGAARVRVPDLRGEEFKEATGSTGATRGDERRRV